ncbi:multicopper oxidase 2A [Rickenella mellea]|uniref:Multicopper oxidase 2A n=1 Tax=Rickenella mellea TaxID=50990 RepID=A0A4Y7QGG4_9AGAM|nr:multicopper oxidase 2A [Rickenella mellea]
MRRITQLFYLFLSTQLRSVQAQASTPQPDTLSLQPQDPSAFFLSEIQGQPPQTRTFNFDITEVNGAPDGVKRTMLVVNKMFPGPTIEVNQADRLVVNVHNGLTNKTSIHWHGLFQNGTAFFDGVSGISECGIPPGETLTYNFTFGEFSGTTWWHALSTEYTDGITGALIVHATAPNPPSTPKYDAELVLQLSDWYHLLSASYLPQFLSAEGIMGLPGAEPVPDTGLINGIGQYHGKGSFFTVGFQHLYRLRLIHTGSFPSLRFSIDSHVLTVIEVDGTIVQPMQIAGVQLGVAQRISVLLTTNQKPNVYWMRSELDTAMYNYVNPGQVTDIRGVIRYSNFKSNVTVPVNTTDPGPGNPKVPDFSEAAARPAIAVNPPASTKQYDLSFIFNPGPTGGVLAFINNISWVPLTNTFTMTEVQAAPITFAPEGLQTLNQNTLVLTEMNLQTIDLRVNNLDNGPHPFHLHGNKFWIVGEGAGTYTNQKLNSNNPLSRDTIIIPASSWVVLRFIGDNAGIWAFHCHIAWHMASGLLMQIVIQPSKIAAAAIPGAITQQCAS